MIDAIIIGDITDVEMVMKGHTKNGKKGEVKEKGYRIENICYKIS